MDNSTEVLKTYERVLDLVTDERKIAGINSKEHQFSVIKTYLWLDVTFIAAIAWLLDYQHSNNALTVSSAIMFTAVSIPVLSGLTLGIIGLSQSLMKVYNSLPLGDFLAVARDAPKYAAPEYKILQLDSVIENYQEVVLEQRKLITKRAKLLHWQCIFSLISLYGVVLCTVSVFIQTGG